MPQIFFPARREELTKLSYLNDLCQFVSRNLALDAAREKENERSAQALCMSPTAHESGIERLI